MKRESCILICIYDVLIQVWGSLPPQMQLYKWEWTDSEIQDEFIAFDENLVDEVKIPTGLFI